MLYNQGETPRNDLSFIDRIDWDKMRDEVASKVIMLGAAARASATQDSAMRDRIRRDLILPHLRLLMQFCEAIKEGEE